MGPLFLILVQLVMASGAKPKQADMSCLELATYGTDDGEGIIGGSFPADSRGRFVLIGDADTYHCTAKAKNSKVWVGEFKVTKDRELIVLTLPE